MQLNALSCQLHYVLLKQYFQAANSVKTRAEIENAIKSKKVIAAALVHDQVWLVRPG